MKHQFGSWKVEECHEVGIFNDSYLITCPSFFPRCEDDSGVICRLPTGMGKFSTQYRNAYLIAAAPELLAAMEKLIEHAELAHWDKQDSVFGITCDHARAAIAKAKGEL